MTRGRLYRAGLFALSVLTIGLYALFAGIGMFVTWDVSVWRFEEWSPYLRLIFAVSWLLIAWLVRDTVKRKITEIEAPARTEEVGL